jgi:L-lysine 2,3-aminomutase
MGERVYCQFCERFILPGQRRKHLLQHRNQAIEWLGLSEGVSDEQLLKACGLDG